MKYLRIPIIVVTVALLLSGCITVPAPQPAPQEPAVQEVVQAPPAATQAAPVVVVVTATPDTTSNTASNTSAGCSDSAELGNVDPPDGAKIGGGKDFKMTWELFNTGTCTWDSNYIFVFMGGEQMASLTEVKPLSENTIPPGSSLTIFITMRSPAESGDYIGYWSWANSKGNGDPVPVTMGGGASGTVYVRIIVP